MTQSALIGGALVAGFVLWIARQDRLSSYARVFFGNKPDSHAGASPANANDKGTVVPDNIFDVFHDLNLTVPSLPSLPAVPGFGH